MHISKLSITVLSNRHTMYPCEVKGVTTHDGTLHNHIRMDNDTDLFPDIFLNRLPHLTHITISSRWPYNVNIDLSIFRMCRQLESVELCHVILVPCSHDLHGCTGLKSIEIDSCKVKDTELESVDATPGLDGKRRLSIRDNTLFDILVSLPSTIETLDLSLCKDSRVFRVYNDVYNLDGIRRMTSLKRLNLDHIGFTMEDDTLASLTNLEIIDIFFSISMVIPESISALTSLKYLRVDHYNIERPLPDSFYTMTSLKKLRFSNGTGLYSDMLRDICNGQIASNLRSLDLLRSRFNNKLPSTSELTNLKKLKWLSLPFNDLHGTIDVDTIDGIPSLRYIDVRNNWNVHVDPTVYKIIQDIREGRLHR